MDAERRQLDRDLLVHGRFTVMFFAMVISGIPRPGSCAPARVDPGRDDRTLAGIAGYFNLVPGGRDLLTLYAARHRKDPNVSARSAICRVFALQIVSRPAARICAARSYSASSRWRSCWRFARPGVSSSSPQLSCWR
jgi:hypothetical protein